MDGCSKILPACLFKKVLSLLSLENQDSVNSSVLQLILYRYRSCVYGMWMREKLSIIDIKLSSRHASCITLQRQRVTETRSCGVIVLSTLNACRFFFYRKKEELIATRFWNYATQNLLLFICQIS